MSPHPTMGLITISSFSSSIFNGQFYTPQTPPVALLLSSLLIIITTTIIIIIIIIVVEPVQVLKRLLLHRLFNEGRYCCRCRTCESYVSGSWRSEFPNLSDWYTHLLRESPTKTVQVHVLGATVTANPENVEHVLRARFDNYPKGEPFAAILGDFLGQGIFNADGDTWQFQKKLAARELDSASVRRFAFEVIREEIENRLLPLVSSVAGRDGAVLDLQDVFRRFSFDCICKFSFGLDPECLDDLSVPLSEFASAFELASKLSAERALSISPLIWKMKRLLNVGSERRLKQAIKVINGLALDLIDHRRINNNKSNINNNNDLLSRFMDKVTDESYLRDIVVSFLLAGRDTVASALTGFFWLIADHPEVESAILAEADRVAAAASSSSSSSFTVESHSDDNNNNNLDPRRIRELHYLQAAVLESLRLYPPVQFDSKYCLEDDVLPDGTVIEKGTRVTYHPYAMGRMEDIWGKDCLDFNPTRWLVNKTNDQIIRLDDQNQIQDNQTVLLPISSCYSSKTLLCRKESPFKYPVFQGGVRVCLGREMALLQIKTVVLSLLTNFHFEMPSSSSSSSSSVKGCNKKRTPTFSPGLTATFRDGMPVIVRKRVHVNTTS